MPKKVSSSLRHRLLRPVHKIKKKVNHSTRISSHYFGRHRKQSEQNVNSWAGHLIYFPLRLFPPFRFFFFETRRPSWWAYFSPEFVPQKPVAVQNPLLPLHVFCFAVFLPPTRSGVSVRFYSRPKPPSWQKRTFLFSFFFFSFLQILTYTKRDCLGNGPSSSSCGRSQIEKWDKTSVAFAVISRAMRSLPK